MSGWNVTGASTPAGAGAPEDALSVARAVGLAAGALDNLPEMTVLGEVTGFRGPNARSGHCYFQVKDDAAAMDCAIWKQIYGARSFDLRDGMQVILKGRFNIYKPTGKMSFIVRSFSLAGEGLLRQQVAELAERLRREGLMDASRKRRIPVFCTRVAVVTSLSGAVIDDVKRTLRRRNPLVELVCVGSKVQGEGAPAELIEGLRRAASITPAPECILLVRGGGSFEDLMTFNDEGLARAVAASPIPVITGIGHEPDTSICDMVSDRRSSTPTAAAESVAPAITDLADRLDERETRLIKTVAGTVSAARSELTGLTGRIARAMDGLLSRERAALAAAASHAVLTRPGATLERRAVELDQTSERLVRAGDRTVERHRVELGHQGSRLSTLGTGLAQDHAHRLSLLASRLRSAGGEITRPAASSLSSAAAALDALSPLKVLARGYSIAYAAGHVAASTASFIPGSELRVRLADGDVYGTVTDVKPAGR